MLVVAGTYGEKLGHVDGKGAGLYVMRFDRRKAAFAPSDGFIGAPQLGGIDGLRNPTFVTSHRDETSGELHLYIVDERHDGPGTVAAARLNEATGELQALGAAVTAAKGLGPGAGAACCHVSVAPGGRHVLAANYLCGSVVAIARLPDGTLDGASAQYVDLPPSSHPVSYPGPHAGRQEAAHAHMALFSPGRQCTSLLVPDLGSDVVWCLPYEAPASQPLGTPVAAASHPSLAGGGPRHVALHPTVPMAYVAYELTSVVAAFAVDVDSGALTGDPLGVVNVLCGASPGHATAAGAFLSGDVSREQPHAKLLHDSARGHAVCDDAETSVAAVRVTPDGTHVVVSSRLVGQPGALSAVALAPTGHFVESMPVRITSTVGRTPRDFALLRAKEGRKRTRRGAATAGLLALAANQDTDELVAMAEGEQATVLTKAVPTPVCLCVISV